MSSTTTTNPDPSAPTTDDPTTEQHSEMVARVTTAAGAVRAAADRRVLFDLNARRDALSQLESFLIAHTDTLTEALERDLGKSPTEAWSTEIGFTINQIRDARDHLERWAAPRKVKLPLKMRPGRARIVPQPLGAVCIIAPWNYPVQLTLAPLVAALAAGNTAVIKPSEIAPATEAVLASHLEQYLGDYVSVVTGGADTVTELLTHRFDHIFYTGNGRVGRIVMQAAAQHLTPVTLELGGKSPAVVTASADIDIAARRIAWGKFVNAGQTCVAPDYVLVEGSVRDRFVDQLRISIERFFGDDPSLSPDYGRIVNGRHLGRLVSLLDDPGAGHVVTGGLANPTTRYLAPTVLTDTATDAALMDEEIFGPILPVLSFDDLEEAITAIGARPHPLALYVFSADDHEVERVLAQTASGGALVNHTLLHLAVEGLPFGGVGESGMGSYHGRAGFDTFSHLRSVYARPTKPDPKVMYPPYGSIKQRILRRML
jgi:aldehyde dehydrogenase (NAD+)